MSLFGKGMAAIVSLMLSAGCNSGASSADEPAAQNLAAFQQFDAGELKFVTLDLDDCSLTLSEGPNGALRKATATCNAAELRRARDLLSDEAWNAYVGLSASELGQEAPDEASSGSTAEAPDAGAECEGATCPPEQPGDVGSPAIGDAYVDGTVTVTLHQHSKVFWADSTGAEQDLLRLFQELHDKYGRF